LAHTSFFSYTKITNEDFSIGTLGYTMFAESMHVQKIIEADFVISPEFVRWVGAVDGLVIVCE